MKESKKESGDNIISKDIAIKFLRGMGRSLILSKYNVVYFDLYTDTDDSQVHKISHMLDTRRNLSYECEIGIKCLIDNTDSDGFVRNRDLIACGKRIAHEAQHLERHFNTYQRGMSDKMRDMARMEMIATYCDGYKRDTYWYQPCEIDADKFGMLNAVRYFDENLVDENGEPLIDAKQSMFEKLREERGNRVWHAGVHVTDFDSAIQALTVLGDHYKTCYRNFPFDSRSEKDRIMYQMLVKYPGWEEMLKEDGGFGIEYDEKLMAMLLDVDTTFVDIHKGMWRDAERVRELYPSQLSVGEKVSNHVISVIRHLDEESLNMESELLSIGKTKDISVDAEDTLI